jgi:hypothetical protein
MANKPDGGIVVVGVDDDGTTLTPTGLTPAQIATWGYDDLHASVSNYADPYVDLDVGVVALDSKHFIAIEVEEFSDLPVICKGEYPKIALSTCDAEARMKRSRSPLMSKCAKLSTAPRNSWPGRSCEPQVASHSPTAIDSPRSRGIFHERSNRQN